MSHDQKVSVTDFAHDRGGEKTVQDEVAAGSKLPSPPIPVPKTVQTGEGGEEEPEPPSIGETEKQGREKDVESARDGGNEVKDVFDRFTKWEKVRIVAIVSYSAFIARKCSRLDQSPTLRIFTATLSSAGAGPSHTCPSSVHLADPGLSHDILSVSAVHPRNVGGSEYLCGRHQLHGEFDASLPMPRSLPVSAAPRPRYPQPNPTANPLTPSRSASSSPPSASHLSFGPRSLGSTGADRSTSPACPSWWSAVSAWRCLVPSGRSSRRGYCRG